MITKVKMFEIKYAFLGGLILYFPFLLTGYLSYMKVSLELLVALFLFSVLIGGIISIYSIAYKNQSLKYVFIRSIVLFLSLFLITAINGSIGTVRLLDRLLQIETSQMAELGFGLGMALFLFSVLSICIITNVVLVIRRLFIKKNA